MNPFYKIFGPPKRLKKDECGFCGRYEMYGKDLVFISRIERNGSGTVDVSTKSMLFVADDLFKISCLSITNGTYIAAGFNSYVVKLKTS